MRAPTEYRPETGVRSRVPQGAVKSLTCRKAVSLLTLACPLLVSCAGGRAPAQNGGDLPERLGTLVAPDAATPWRPPDLQGYSKALRPTERVPIDPARQYDLLELIVVADRANPETRVAWERARQAAIGVGLVESEYLPML